MSEAKPLTGADLVILRANADGGAYGAPIDDYIVRLLATLDAALADYAREHEAHGISISTCNELCADLDEARRLLTVTNGQLVELTARATAAEARAEEARRLLNLAIDDAAAAEAEAGKLRRVVEASRPFTLIVNCSEWTQTARLRDALRALDGEGEGEKP